MQALLSQLKNDPKLTPHTTCQQPLNSSSKHFLMYYAASLRQAISFLTICTQIYSVICSAYSFISTRMSQNFISVEICMLGGTQSLGIPALDCFSSYTLSFYLLSFSFVAIKDNLNNLNQILITPIPSHYATLITPLAKIKQYLLLSQKIDGLMLAERLWVQLYYDNQLKIGMKHRHLHRNNQFVSLGNISLEQLASLDALHKQSSTFLTQKAITNEEEIFQRHIELNHYLDNLDKKVTAVIQQNEAEILTAYKKHFARIKKELEDFKKQTEAQANSSNSFREKIELLEKQLVIFRDESLKLFSKVTEKDKTIEQLRFTLDELLSEKKYMDGVVKQLTKRNKELQCEREKIWEKKTDNMVLDINSFSKKFIAKNRHGDKSQQYTLRPSSNMSKAQRNFTKQSRTIAVDRSFQDFQQSDTVGHLIREKLPKVDQSTFSKIKEIVLQLIGDDLKKRSIQVKALYMQRQRERYDQNQTRLTNRSKSNYTVDLSDAKQSIDYNEARNKETLKQRSQQFSNNLELCEYFKKCIDTVRKQIGVRKKVSTISFYKQGTPIGIEQFKKMDFFRLMQLICSHQSVILSLYNALIQTKK